MKKFLTLLLVLPISILNAQKNGNCLVMVPALRALTTADVKTDWPRAKVTARGKDTYTGFFRKGFPDGKGIYIWASGNKYNGQWKMGLREGEGTFTGTVGGKDTVMAGIWKRDSYAGPKPAAPRIIQKVNVVSASFKRTGEGSAITFSFYQNGKYNYIESSDFSASSGSENRSGNYTVFYTARFPFSCKVIYKSWNSLRTILYDCILEFEITQPGNWDIRIDN